MKQHKVTRLFLDFEKEENWLNEMAAKGQHFVRYCMPHYLFREGNPGEFIYRIELLDNLPSHAEGQEYIKFVEETGAECVDTFWRWAYFRRKSTDGPFDLYTDVSSRLRHYQRIMILSGILTIIEMAMALFQTAMVLHGPVSYRNTTLVSMGLSVAATAICATLFLSYWRRVRELNREKTLRD